MPTPERQAKIERVEANRLPGVLVVLEDIVDPHNAAAILRSCDGLGIGAVWYLFDQIEPYDPRSVGKCSSATANRWVPLQTFTDRAEVETHLQHDGYTSIATTVADPDAEQLWACDLRVGNLALWVGNEHRGLSSTAQAFCERQLTIPMYGMVESFNVSVATALILAEVARQRRAGVTG